MTTLTYFDRETLLDYHMRGHIDESRISADNMIDDEGYCLCCGVDYTGLDRDILPDGHQDAPLEPHPWTPGIDGDDPEYAQGRVDFDDDEGTTIASVRVTRTGGGFLVHLDQMSDLDNLVIVHTND